MNERLKGLPPIQFDGVSRRRDHGKQDHSRRADHAPDVEQQELAAEQMRVGMEIQSDSADDQQHADLGRPKKAVRPFEAVAAICRELCLDREPEKRD